MCTNGWNSLHFWPNKWLRVQFWQPSEKHQMCPFWSDLRALRDHEFWAKIRPPKLSFPWTPPDLLFPLSFLIFSSKITIIFITREQYQVTIWSDQAVSQSESWSAWPVWVGWLLADYPKTVDWPGSRPGTPGLNSESVWGLRSVSV